ncbi:YceD family protein [Demequina sp. TTPB684]|uniref:YceD family protein n=1 Tax=unclassified Demequina TaxID=2620311 RepID=UPI001CF1AFF8|nr:YceD family protein [Demequina sp. TMPB413]MCB2411813.1 YceD family protein [Demequina sp. TTPB684]UPU88834.1 YceD family protein [Demequina sp. TMPB413]
MKHSPEADTNFRIHVRDLVRRPGTHREYSRELTIPEALGTEVIGVPQGSAATLNVQCEVVTDGIWVSGTFAARATGECSRCLEEVRVDLEVPVQGLFLYPDAPREQGDDADDVFEFDGESLDLEGVVRDAVVTSLPFTPLCEPDCPGLCDQCGAPLANDPDHAHEILDPRWSALESVKDSLGLSDKEES